MTEEAKSGIKILTQTIEAPDTALHFKLTEVEKKRLGRLAKKKGVSMSRYLRILIAEDYMQKYGKEI